MRGKLSYESMFVESSSICNAVRDSIFEVAGTLTTDWKEKSVLQWESKDIMFWIISVARENDLNPDDINISQFNDLDGTTLFTMLEEDFTMRENKYGRLLFSAMQQLKYKLQKTGLYAAGNNKPFLEQWKDAGYRSSYGDSVYIVSELYSTALNKRLEFSISSPDVVTTDWKSKSVKQWNSNDIMFWMISVAHDSNLNIDDINISQFNNLDGKMLSSMSESDFISRENIYGKVLFSALQQIKLKVQKSDESVKETKISHRNEIVKKKPRRTRGLGCKGRQSAKKMRKLWEFIRDLLLNRDYCPSLICWENYDEGVFRFVNSKGVAELWGKLKKNKNMTYDKLSRGMRHYYKSEVFLPVLGKRLVYKFGPSATGWRTPNPNFRL
ncbi:ETS-related transcription factor Elf-5-like isoform X2 [Periplaneta americana]|uniref:ETS-related transcription factor Elf-5-like isoform X2 n=1 Tax=Periplaneta americana TaxID=6978 RepID=UPI0037E7D4A0